MTFGLGSVYHDRRLNLDRDSSICLDCKLQVGDEDSRHEGVEIERSSPFHLSRILAKEFGYRSVSWDIDKKICVWERFDVCSCIAGCSRPCQPRLQVMRFDIGISSHSWNSGDRTSIMWTLISDGEATESIGVIADIRRESEFTLELLALKLRLSWPELFESRF